MSGPGSCESVDEYRLEIERVSGPGGWFYVVTDRENEERGVLYGPVKQRDCCAAFCDGYATAMEAE